jgi:hypothetical protein
MWELWSAGGLTVRKRTTVLLEIVDEFLIKKFTPLRGAVTFFSG